MKTLVYFNNECGNIHDTYESMIREAVQLYDYGDPCNIVHWSEYYTKMYI